MAQRALKILTSIAFMRTCLLLGTGNMGPGSHKVPNIILRADPEGIKKYILKTVLCASTYGENKIAVIVTDYVGVRGGLLGLG